MFLCSGKLQPFGDNKGSDYYAKFKYRVTILPYSFYFQSSIQEKKLRLEIKRQSVY